MTNYYIKNIGCDDETYGLVRVDEEMCKSAYFLLFKQYIQNLNLNSIYMCKPEIEVYKIPDSIIREAIDGDRKEDIMYTCDGKFVLTDSIEYWDEKEYTYKLKEGIERVI